MWHDQSSTFVSAKWAKQIKNLPKKQIPRATSRQTDNNPFPGKPGTNSKAKIKDKYEIKVNSISNFSFQRHTRTEQSLAEYSATIVATEDTSVAEMCWKLNRNSSLGDIPKPAKLFSTRYRKLLFLFLFHFFIYFYIFLFCCVCFRASMFKFETVGKKVANIKYLMMMNTSISFGVWNSPGTQFNSIATQPFTGTTRKNSGNLET